MLSLHHASRGVRCATCLCVGVSEYTPYDVVQQSASTYTSLVCWCVDTLASMHRQRATYSLGVVHRCLVQYYIV